MLEDLCHLGYNNKHFMINSQMIIAMLSKKKKKHAD